jgi:hypothetical protein
MKKNGKAILGFATGAIIIIALAAVAFSQKPGKNPPKPPADTTVWGAQIQPYMNMSGMDDGNFVYESGVNPNVRITVSKNTTGSTVNYTEIHFFIYANANNDENGDPLDTYMTFQAAPIVGLTTGVAGPLPTGFPTIYGNSLGAFLNSNHPKQGYDHIFFRFVIADDLENEAIFPIGGDPQKYTGGRTLYIYLWNSFDCLIDGEPFPYHSVMLHLADWCNEDTRGYYIMRKTENTWEFWLEGQILEVIQSYCYSAVTGEAKNKKPIVTTTYWEPQSGLVNLSYKIDLIKNPK